MKHFIIWLLYFIQGLTCTEQNFITKAGAQRTAAKEGIMIVAPDTSPRKLQFFLEGQLSNPTTVIKQQHTS